MITGSRWFTAAVVLALAAAPAYAKDTPGSHAAQSSASETGAGDDAIQHIVNVTYAFDTIYTPDRAASAGVLYEQRVTSNQSLGAEAPASEMVVTAYAKGAKGYDRKLWSIRDNANYGEALGDYYRTTLFGCCASENTERSYYTGSGKLAFTASVTPLFASIPNTPVVRAFAYLSAYATDSFDLERWPAGAALITIVDGDRTVDRVLLEAVTDNFQWTPEITLADPAGKREINGDTFELWAADGNPDPALITGFDLSLTWDAELGHIARLPVVAGKFDLTHAKLPTGLTARRLPAE